MKNIPHLGITISSFPNPFPGNPYLDILYSRLEHENVKYEKSGYFGQEWLRANRGKVKFIHFHWVNGYYETSSGKPSFYRLIIFLGKIWFARLLGYQVIWTMHNLYPHDRQRTLKAWICRFLFIQSVTLIFINFSSARQDLKKIFWRTHRVFLIPHGNYRPIYSKIPDRASARRLLGLADAHYLFFLFGGIRPYKGAHKAIAAFARMENEQEAMLIIMGQCLDKSYQSQLIALAASNQRVKLMLEKEDITDEQLNLWMAAIDCLVAPYEDVYTSGVLYMAATFEKPIISPRKGIFKELDDMPFIITYDCESNIDVLTEKFTEAMKIDTNFIQNSAKQFADDHEWPDIARQISLILQSQS